MKSKLIFAIGIAASILLGCKNAANVTETGSLQNSQQTTGTTPGQPAPTSPPPVVPEELKSDAYHYFGLASEKPLKLKLSGGMGGDSVGTQEFHLKSVKDGKAVFEVDRSGDIGDKLGTETVSLEKDGVFTIKSTQVQGDIH